MNLFDLMADYPDAFHQSQDWYVNESFMGTHLPENIPERIVGVKYQNVPPDMIPWQLIDAVPTVTLAWLYIQNPSDPMFKHYLWTSDLDNNGQRVYIGDNGLGLEIHRHIHFTDRFGVPKWK